MPTLISADERTPKGVHVIFVCELATHGCFEVSAELQELGAARAVVRIAEHSVARVVRLVAHFLTKDAARK